MQKPPHFLGIAALLLAAIAASGQQASAGNAATPTNPPNVSAPHNDYDPLLDLPPLPRNRVTLIGGTVRNLDEVMNRMVVQPFGTKKQMEVRFDSRTRFFRDGTPITQRDIHQAQRVYVDTMLNGNRVFAKTIWIQTAVEGGLTHGQIIDVDLQGRRVTVRDELSRQPTRFQIVPATVVRKDNQPGTLNDLQEGALVALQFSPERQISEVNVLATPGSTVAFVGRLTYLDLSRKVLAIASQTDGKHYDVYMDAIAQSVQRQLREGQNVTVSAVFDGERYSARQINISSPAPQPR